MTREELIKAHISICRMKPNSTAQPSNSVDIDKVMDMVLVVLYSITIILGITGNGVVIWITGCKVKRVVNNVWFLNLAVADFIFCLSRTISLAKNLFYDYWPFGEFLCKFNGFFKYANMFCSVFLLAVISMDRCISVLYPLSIKEWRTLRSASFISLIVWALAVSFSLPYFVFRQTSLDPSNGNLTKCSLDIPGSEDGRRIQLVLYTLRFLCGFMVPFIIITICYILTAYKLKQTRSPKYSRSLKLIAALVAAFFFCWAPYHVFLLAKMVKKKSPVVRVGLPLFKGLAYLNSCINPILYFFMGVNFKKKQLGWKLSSILKRVFVDDWEHSQRTMKKESSSPANTLENTVI
ncbi:chemerin-like receptor 1 [Erpetoichthys calabaricus]|uniref:chemerin-like receptor 1 n=1 Tax=Erpetoichthys calabaricus TaxID=27687 RepID=UPI002234485A|nr:chemerin-like receptor 1 [Erpetoichthys calabaricus]